MASSAQPLIEHYVSLGVGETLKLDGSSTNLGDGWDRNTYLASVLCEFPPSRPLPSKIALGIFCLPSGLRPCTEPKAPAFSCFVLTRNDGERLYGHCLTIHEPLPPETRVQLGEDSCRTNDGETSMPTIGELSGGTPFFVPKCLCFVSHAHYPLAFKASLMALHQMCTASVNSALTQPIETVLSHLVLNVPLPVRGGPTVRFRLAPTQPALHVSCSHPSQLPSMDYSVGILLRRLSPAALLKAFHALVLEHQVVVVSDDDELRLGACELLMSFLHPLEWAQVYVPTIPDAWVDLLSNPFPCLLGVREAQRPYLPQPLPATMCIVDLAAGRVLGPAAPLPSLPPREARRLQERLRTLHSDYKSLGTADLTVADAALAHADATSSIKPEPALFEARTRAAFLELFVSLLRDLDRFLPDSGPPAALPSPRGGATELDMEALAKREEEREARLEAFVVAQPSNAHKFLRDLLRTQLFLSFVQPVDDQGVRGGRCFALARDAFLRREIVTISEDDDAQQQRHAVRLVNGPTPAEQWIKQPDGSSLRKGVSSTEGDADDPLDSTWNADDLLGAMPHQAPKLYEVPLPTTPRPAEGREYVYSAGFPAELSASLLAEQIPLPVFEGEPVRPLRVTPELRASWSEVSTLYLIERVLPSARHAFASDTSELRQALAKLEARQEQREQGKMVATGALVVSAVAVAACSIQ